MYNVKLLLIIGRNFDDARVNAEIPHIQRFILCRPSNMSVCGVENENFNSIL